MGLITGKRSHLVHPSNRLYNNEVRGREAIKTFIGQLRFEASLNIYDDEDRAAFQAEIAHAERLLAEWDGVVAAAEQQLALRWQSSGNETTRQFGEALVSGDYSRLAI